MLHLDLFLFTVTMLLLVLLIPAAAVLGSAPESCSSGFSAKNGKSSDFWNLSLAGEAFNATARQLVDNMEATNIEYYLKYFSSIVLWIIMIRSMLSIE